MALILDSGALTAVYDHRDHWHPATKDLLLREPGPLIVPTPVIPEVDYFLGKRLGFSAQTQFYKGIVEGAYLTIDLSEAGYQRVLELNQQYPHLRLGFVDAAVIAIADWPKAPAINSCSHKTRPRSKERGLELSSIRTSLRS